VDSFWVGLGLKAAATALVVVTASVVSERLGPRWGGVIASIPVSAGPAYALLGLQHDADFLAHSALLSLVGGVATWTFLTVFVRLADHRGILVSLCGALSVWLIAAVILRQLPWTLTTALLANALFFAAARRWGRARIDVAAPAGALAREWYEVPLRAILVGGFVAAVVTLSDAIGPAATGLAAVFPIALTSLAILTHRRFGIAGSAVALSGAITPIIGIACGFAVLAGGATVLGTWPALGLSLIAALAWPMYIILRRRA